jgi:hypothetical protein
MPGASDRELPIPVRRFQGTMLAMDPAFVPPGFVTRCENWVPDLSLVVSKRLGSAPWQRLPQPGRVDPLVYCSGSDGTRYLYCVANDELYVSVNDAPIVAVSNGIFSAGPTEDLRYGAAVVGDTLYIGNDVDPIKQVPLGAAAVDLVPLALLDDTGQVATAINDELARVLAGTYSYRWAVYNGSTQRWTKVGPVRTVTTAGAGRQRLGFRAPTVALGANELYHLFLAGVDQEIEGAHDQTPAGLPASSGSDQFALWDDPAIESASVPIPSTVVRRGAHLIAHRGRLWGAGGLDATARRAWATNVLVPGLEQSLFEQGLFFPAGAVTPDLGGPVTGFAVATLSSTNRSPTSPLALFTETSTWLYFGDPLDDPSATLVQVSDEIGCPGDRTVASTPLGIVFCGKRSVYLLTPQQAEPKDIGWPIEPAIRAVPVPERARCWAIYHRGFYKLALVPPGGTTPTEQWWLDLRRGLGDPPQWWGPHTTPGYSAATRATNHPAEEDRAWATQDSSVAFFVLLDQADRYMDPVGPRSGGQWNVAQWNVDDWAQEVAVPIVSRLITADLDGNAPLTPKIAKRARVVAHVFETTSLGITVTADHAYGVAGTLRVPIALGDVWDTADWNTAEWAMQQWILSEFECPVPEPRGRLFSAVLTHVDPLPCDLRDFELRVQPSGRETQ